MTNAVNVSTMERKGLLGSRVTYAMAVFARSTSIRPPNANKQTTSVEYQALAQNATGQRDVRTITRSIPQSPGHIRAPGEPLSSYHARPRSIARQRFI